MQTACSSEQAVNDKLSIEHNLPRSDCIRSIDLYTEKRNRVATRALPSRLTPICSLVVACSFRSGVARELVRDNVTWSLTSRNFLRQRRKSIAVKCRRVICEQYHERSRNRAPRLDSGLSVAAATGKFEQRSRGSCSKWVNTRSRCLLQNARAFRFACAVCKRRR